MTADGKATWLRDLRLTGTDELSPIADEPGARALLLGKVEPRGSMRFASADAAWPGTQRVDTLADEHSKIQGRALGDAPDLIPMSAAMGAGVLFVTPPVGGTALSGEWRSGLAAPSFECCTN